GILADKFPTAADVPDGRARSRHFSSARSQTRHGEAGCEAETFATLEQIRTIAAQAGCTMAELSLAWIAHQTGIVSVIAGAANPQQLQANLNFVERTLPEDIITNLNRATAPLLDVLGSNPDMWDGTENSRYH
ncbi:MAG: aldo/keto reductase, partial [Planctomycetaceae bacterium]